MYCCCCLATKSCLTLCDPMDYSCQAPLSMEFSRQEYWSGLPFPSPGYRPNSGIEYTSAALAGGLFTTEPSLDIAKYKKIITYQCHKCHLAIISIQHLEK